MNESKYFEDLNKMNLSIPPRIYRNNNYEKNCL